MPKRICPQARGGASKRIACVSRACAEGLALNPQTIMFPVEDAVKRGVRAQRVATFLSGLDVKKSWEIIVRPFRRKRSNQQNRYERGVACVLIAKAIGYDPDDVHEYLLGRYFGWKQERCPRTPSNQAGIKDVPIRTTTTNAEGDRDVLPKQEYWDFVEYIQRFGAHYGVHIPDPDPEYATRHDRSAA
jgi:hypothetical protein